MPLTRPLLYILFACHPSSSYIRGLVWGHVGGTVAGGPDYVHLLCDNSCVNAHVHAVTHPGGFSDASATMAVQSRQPSNWPCFLP
jgi:hypothetical protein